MTRWWLVLVLVCILGGRVEAQEITPEPTPDPRIINLEILEEAQAAQAAANEQISLYLELIQYSSVIVGLIAFAATAFGISRVARLDQILREVKKQNDTFETIRQDIEAREKAIRVNLDNYESRHDSVTQALAMVQFAMRQIEIGNLSAAAKTLEKAEQEDPDNRTIQYFLGEVYVRNGEAMRGRDHLEQASQDDDFPDAHATLAYSYRILGDIDPTKRDQYYSKAESLYTELWSTNASLLDISGESVFGALAGLYRRQNRIDKALQVYELVAEETPYSSYPLNNLGLLNLRYQDMPYASREASLEHFRRSRKKAKQALQADRANYWRLFDLATAEVALEEVDLDTILGHLDDAFDFEPVDIDVKKLHDGLAMLTDNPPKHLTAVLAFIEERYPSVNPQTTG